MTPSDRLRDALATLHWSGRSLAAILRTDERKVRRWASGAYEPPEAVVAWLEALAAYHASHPPPAHTNPASEVSQGPDALCDTSQSS